MGFIDADEKELREGFYVRQKDDKVYYLGEIRKYKFTVLSEQFPGCYVKPYASSVIGYALFAKEFNRIDKKRDSRMRRKGVRTMRQTLAQRIQEAA